MRVSENLSKNGIGVEVTDFSLSDLTEENISFLRSKWVEYGLIVFPELPLSHDEFKDFALSFGDFGDDPFISSLPDYPNIAEIKRSANETKATFSHPMVKIHPETNKECLFINPVYTINVEGFSEDESQQLLWELYEHMIKDQFVYEHVWNDDMLIMWDNRTVMHQATGGYDGYDRLLHRITLAAV